MKVKAHRGEPLNEGADDQAETGRAMEKEGENFRWQERTTRVVYPYYDRNLGQWEKSTWTKTVRNAARRGAAESLMEERLQFGANKWRKGLFEGRSEDTDGDQPLRDQNWRSDAPLKWDMIASGKWMQKAAWNRWVTTMERDQPHKTLDVHGFIVLTNHDGCNFHEPTVKESKLNESLRLNAKGDEYFIQHSACRACTMHTCQC